MKMFFFALFSILPFSFASAHEVYVLESDRVRAALELPPFSFSDIFFSHIGAFALGAVISTILILFTLWLSTRHFCLHTLRPLDAVLKKYSRPVLYFFVSIALLFAAYHQSFFGPELSAESSYGTSSIIISVLLAISGLLFISPKYKYERQAAMLGTLVFLLGLFANGLYMFTYITYLGIFLATIFFAKNHLDRAVSLVRITFGCGLIFASVYAKIIHNNLALFAVEDFHLDKIMGFEPHFIVLGAATVEIVIALMFIFGITIRFTSAVLIVVLCMSLGFFGEALWPHIILFAVPTFLFMYGYDNLSLEKIVLEKIHLKPMI